MPQNFQPENPPKIHQILERLKSAIRGTRFTLDDILTVIVHLFYHGSGNQLKTKSREQVKTDVRPYGIGVENLRKILNILHETQIIQKQTNRTKALEDAEPLYQYARNTRTTVVVPPNVWQALEVAVQNAYIRLNELFIVVKALFYEKKGKICCKGRTHLYPIIKQYSIPRNRLEAILAFLEEQGVTIKREKYRVPTIIGIKLWHEITQGITPPLPEESVPPQEEPLAKVPICQQVTVNSPQIEKELHIIMTKLTKCAEQEQTTLETILKVVRELFYEENGQLKVNPRDSIESILRKQRIYHTELRSIYQILKNTGIIDRTPNRRTIPTEIAKILYCYLQETGTEIEEDKPQLPQNVWKVLEKQAKSHGIDIKQLFAVVTHLFEEKDGQLFPKGRERILKDLKQYEMGGRKVRAIMSFLEEQQIMKRREESRKRIATPLGERLQEELDTGQIVASLPPISGKLTTERETRKYKEDKYLDQHQRSGLLIPDQDEARSLLKQIWNLPKMNRETLCRLLHEETGIAMAGSTVSRYCVGKRSIPGHVRAAIFSIYTKMEPNKLRTRLEEQVLQETQQQEEARVTLRSLFEDGLPFPEISQKLKGLGLEISPPTLVNMAAGTQQIPFKYIVAINELRKIVSEQYPEIPDPKSLVNMIEELEQRGYSTDSLAREIHAHLPLILREKITERGVSALLKRTKKKPDRKKTLLLGYRVAIKQVYDKFSKKRSIRMEGSIEKIAHQLEKENIPIAFKKAKFNKEESILRLATILVAKQIQEFIYSEYKDRRREEPDKPREIAPIGSRSIAAYTRRKGLKTNYNDIERLQRALERMNMLKSGWLTEVGKGFIANSLERPEEVIDGDVIYLLRFRSMKPKQFKWMLQILQESPEGIAQYLLAKILQINDKSFRQVVVNLEKLQLLQRNDKGDLFMTSLSAEIASKLQGELPVTVRTRLKKTRETPIGRVRDEKAALGEIFYDYVIAQIFPQSKVIDQVSRPTGVGGIDRLLRNSKGLIAIELKALEKESAVWRNYDVYRTLLNHLSNIAKEHGGTWPIFSCLMTTARIDENFFVLRWKRGKQEKVYNELSRMPYSAAILEPGLVSVRIPVVLQKTKLIPFKPNTTFLDMESERNKKWVEILVYGDPFIRTKIKHNVAALLLLETLQQHWKDFAKDKKIRVPTSRWEKAIKESSLKPILGVEEES